MALHSLKNVKTVHIKYESEEDDTLYEGDFTIQRLSISGFHKQQVRKLQLNGGYHYDGSKPGVGISRELEVFNDTLSHLEVAIIKAPEWWNLDEITDLGALYAVHKEVIAFENSFLNRGRGSSQDGEALGGGETGSETPSQEPQHREAVREVVEQEVLTAPEP